MGLKLKIEIMQKENIMKYEDIMTVDRFQDAHSMEFKYTPEEFAKEIERMNEVIKNEIEKSNKKLDQGLTNMCNHDVLVMSEYRKFHNAIDYGGNYEYKIEKVFDKSNHRKKSTYRHSEHLIDINGLEKLLGESNVIGKTLTMGSSDISYAGGSIHIGGYSVMSEKEAIKIATKICIGTEAGKAEIERREEDGSKVQSGTKGLIISNAIDGVSCTHVELYLSGDISSSALLKLAIENCNV